MVKGSNWLWSTWIVLFTLLRDKKKNLTGQSNRAGCFKIKQFYSCTICMIYILIYTFTNVTFYLDLSTLSDSMLLLVHGRTTSDKLGGMTTGPIVIRKLIVSSWTSSQYRSKLQYTESEQLEPNH